MKKEDLKKSRQYRVASQNNKSVLVVPTHWCVRFNLTPTELFILRHIQYMTQGESASFTGSVKTLCGICNCSLPTARKALDKLYDLGWLEKAIVQREFDSGKVVDWVRYKANISYDVSICAEGIEDKLETIRERRKTFGRTKPKLGQ